MKSPLGTKGKFNNIVIIVLGVIVVSVLIAVLLLRPTWDKLKQLGTEISTEQTQRDEVKSDAENLEKAKEFFSQDKDAVEQVSTAVPVNPDIPSLLTTIESLARANNVFLTSFSPQQTQATNSAKSAATPSTSPATGATSVEISANFRGQYGSLINFFYALESSLRIVDVKTISVSSSQGALEGNIVFRAYYRPVPGANPQASPTPAPGGGQ